MFGPEYNTIGSPTYLTNNKLSKGNGGHHLNDSTITDDGTNVTFTTPIAGTAISASTGFLGNLTGTASFATNALSASFAPAGNPFPFTGSAQITGSLIVTGSTLLFGPINQGQNNKLSGSVGLDAAIIASSGSTIFDKNDAFVGAVIVGGNSNIIQNIIGQSPSDPRSGIGIFGGYQNEINVGNNSEANVILGGAGNTISAVYGKNIIINGSGNSITGNSNNTIVGSTNSSGTTDNGLIFGAFYAQANGGSFSPILGGTNARMNGVIVENKLLDSFIVETESNLFNMFNFSCFVVECSVNKRVA